MWERVLHICLPIILSLIVGPAYTAQKKHPLPADEAFVLSVSAQGKQDVLLQWQIAPSYYLYKKHFRITFSPPVQADIHYPKSEVLKESQHKRFDVYTGKLLIPIHLSAPVNQVQVNIAYQGCSAKGFCYPPMQQKVNLDLVHPSLPSAVLASAEPDTHDNHSLISLLTDQNKVSELFSTQHLSLMLLIFIGLGVLLAFTPCVWPMVPILASIIVGQKQPISTGKAFALSAIYVLGAALSYALAGVAAALMGNSLQVWLQKPAIILAVAIIFALLSLSLFGLYELKLPNKWQNRLLSLSNKQQGGNYAGVLLMGVISTLIVSPCVTAPLVGVLIYIGQTGNVFLGASALFALGIGMGLPLMVVGGSAGKWLPKSGAWMETIKKFFGVLLLGMAIWLPLRFFSPFHANTMVASQQLFTIVHSIEDLDKQLLMAQAAHKPVIVDFYADWCESCISMDEHVFNANHVRQQLQAFVLLRADLSANNAADAALLKRFAVIAPPTILFFNHHGQEISKNRIVGEVAAKEFITRLNTFHEL